MATSRADVWPDCVSYGMAIHPFARLAALPPLPSLIAVVPRRALPFADPAVAARVPVRIFRRLRASEPTAPALSRWAVLPDSGEISGISYRFLVGREGEREPRCFPILSGVNTDL